MFRILFSIFLVLHILGDFYCQTAPLAEKKDRRYGYVVIHSLIYAAVFLAGALLFWSTAIGWKFLVLAGFHFVIDSCKFLIRKRVRSATPKTDWTFYWCDQLAHLVSFLIWFVFIWQGQPIALHPMVGNWIGATGFGGKTFLSWFGLLLIIHKPANITARAMLAEYRPKKREDELNNAGALIGSLERIIIVLLLSVGEYAAIGLVLTAKSVARYDNISKDQTFAEYYLLGTLLSTLFAIGSFRIFI